ncbi:MAG: GNAT family N-acetyltransferase [Tepidisphaeraceae bacterium]|jgi:GNAT superfamily N-acetyltransferase
MPLPVLHQWSAASDDDLVRLYLQTDRRWAEHLAEPEVLEVGTAMCNPAMAGQANHVRDVALPAGVCAEEAYRRVEAYFSERGARCSAWIFGAAGGVSPVATLVKLLGEKGYRIELTDVLALPHMPGKPPAERGDLQVIPSRAGFRQMRELFAEAGAELRRPHLPELAEAHLDDPHLDALLAMRDGRAVAHAGIFGVGELARLGLFYVPPAFRRQGVGRTMLSHILEIARRSLYRHIFAGVTQSQSELSYLYHSVGMRKAGQVIEAVSPRSSE